MKAPTKKIITPLVIAIISSSPALGELTSVTTSLLRLGQNAGDFALVDMTPGATQANGTSLDPGITLGNNVVAEYRFVNSVGLNDDTAGSLNTYASAGTSISTPTFPAATLTSNFQFTSILDPDGTLFSSATGAGASDLSFSVDTSAYNNGTVYVVFGTFVDHAQVSADDGVNTALASELLGTENNSGFDTTGTAFDFSGTTLGNVGTAIAAFGFDNSSGQGTTINFRQINTDTDGSRARFYGIIITDGDATPPAPPSFANGYLQDFSNSGPDDGVNTIVDGTFFTSEQQTITGGDDADPHANGAYSIELVNSSTNSLGELNAARGFVFNADPSFTAGGGLAPEAGFTAVDIRSRLTTGAIKFIDDLGVTRVGSVTIDAGAFNTGMEFFNLNLLQVNTDAAGNVILTIDYESFGDYGAGEPSAVNENGDPDPIPEGNEFIRVTTNFGLESDLNAVDISPVFGVSENNMSHSEVFQYALVGEVPNNPAPTENVEIVDSGINADGTFFIQTSTALTNPTVMTSPDLTPGSFTTVTEPGLIISGTMITIPASIVSANDRAFFRVSK